MEVSDAVRQKVLQHVQRLEKLSPNIMSCRVMVDLEQKHQHQGKPYGVRIDVTVPGAELVVDRVHHEDVYVAVRDAFDAMRKKLSHVYPD